MTATACSCIILWVFRNIFLNLVSLICPIPDGSEGEDDLSALPPDDGSDASVSDATPSEEPGTGEGDPGQFRHYSMLLKNDFLCLDGFPFDFSFLRKYSWKDQFISPLCFSHLDNPSGSGSGNGKSENTASMMSQRFFFLMSYL